MICCRLSATEINLMDFPVPKFVKIQVVSDSMNMNGVTIGTFQFYTEREFSDLEKYYRKEIGDIKLSSYENWKIISWIENKKLSTVQASYDKLKNVWHGFMSISNLPAVYKDKIALGNGFPSLSGSEFINDITAQDLGKDSRTIWLTNGNSVSQNISFYKKHYINRGWILEHSFAKNQSGEGALLMRKGSGQLNLTVSKGGLFVDTNVFAVLIK